MNAIVRVYIVPSRVVQYYYLLYPSHNADFTKALHWHVVLV